MNRIDTNNKYNCCGCTACSTVCPKNAIIMKPDIMGFLYPTIDDRLCVDCGRCLNTCQFKTDYNRYDNYIEPIVYGVRHKNERELSKSQSGAASWAIIETFLTTPAVVYGAAFDKTLRVEHSRCTTIHEAQKLRGSKYVQSDMTGVIASIKKDLMNGERVLFIGTGCQVAGVKSAIPRKLHENLLTVDLVCHATPSPAVWKKYIDYIQETYKSKVVAADFRNKKFGWHSHVETFILENGKELESEVFKFLFYDHLIIRKSCTHCYFTNTKRVSDLTIADFWGWERSHDEWHDNKGVSLLFVNSSKGNTFFEDMKKNILYIKSDLTQCMQPQLKGPSKAKSKVLDEVEQLFQKRGFETLKTKYSRNTIKYKLSHIIPSLARSLEYRKNNLLRIARQFLKKQ